MNDFLRGAMVTACWVAGLFFLRFWRETRDRLFLFFLLAFWVLGLDSIGLALVERSSPLRPYAFLGRLLAFGLIIVGVLDKNRRGRAPGA